MCVHIHVCLLYSLTLSLFLPRLEESCSGLRLQSGRLEEDLNQEKKRFRMLEIRLGNSKRARQDAETWNILLQKEKKFWET